MRVQVKLFATLVRHMPDAEAGMPFEVTLDRGATLCDLTDYLGLPRDQLKVAFVNGRARPLDWRLDHGDEVGLFPPIGGG